MPAKAWRQDRLIVGNARAETEAVPSRSISCGPTRATRSSLASLEAKPSIASRPTERSELQTRTNSCDATFMPRLTPPPYPRLRPVRTTSTRRTASLASATESSVDSLSTITISPTPASSSEITQSASVGPELYATTTAETSSGEGVIPAPP